MDAHLARGLLDAGIINDDEDWNGDLVGSLQAGLTRWAKVTCGCAELGAVDIDVSITSDIQEWGMEAQEWRNSYNGMPLPVGGVALEGNRFKYLYVERTITAWEARQKGLGWALFDLASATLEQTIRLASPHWCYHFLQDYGFEDEEEYEEEESEEGPTRIDMDDGFPTVAKLCKGLPDELFIPGSYGKIVEVLERGIRKHSLNYEDKKLLQDALELYHLLPQAREIDFGDEHGCFQDWGQVLPCGVRWNINDRVPQVADFYHDDLANSGMESRFVYLRGFQFGSPVHTVEKAFADVGLCLTLVGRAARLLGALDGDSTPMEKPVRKRRGKPLAEIFAEERNRIEPPVFEGAMLPGEMPEI